MSCSIAFSRTCLRKTHLPTVEKLPMASVASIQDDTPITPHLFGPHRSPLASHWRNARG